MRVRAEIDPNFIESEVIIKCNKMNTEIENLIRYLSNFSGIPPLLCFIDDCEYFIKHEDILFFETNSDSLFAHTADAAYKVRERLYELENILPRVFIRISKSTIVNISHVLSINRNITSSSLIKFNKSHKQVFVSRRYYSLLRERLLERR